MNAIDALKKLQDDVEKAEETLILDLSNPLTSEDVSCENLNVFDKISGIKSRVWAMLLYPDNIYHAQVLQTVFQDLACIGALHDCDTDDTGQLKKEHYHIVFYFPSQVYRSHILGRYPMLEPRFLQPRKDIKRQVRYLLHLDSPSKYLYPETYLEGAVERFQKYINKEALETTQVIAICDLIENQRPRELVELVRLVCDNGLYSTYRRNAYTFNTIMSQTLMRDK